MQTTSVSYYPISLREVKLKVNRKNGRRVRRKPSYPQIFLFGEDIVRVEGEIPVDLPVEQGQRFLFISHDQTILTHGLHKYPAKFFPELPRWLIKRYSNEGERVLDPFSGSGTTNVEALLNRRHSVGIDVDPFSRYLARVKTTPLNRDELELLELSRDKLLQSVLDFQPSLVGDADIPKFPYRDQWFKKEITLELAYIRKKVEELDADTGVKDFFKICFSSILRSVSNADDNCTRTVVRKKLNKEICPSDALTNFSEAVLINVPKMLEFSQRCQNAKDIFVEFPDNQDARSIKYPEDYFDLAVTSPPYANAVDYPRTHQLEIYWLGFETGSLTPLKKKHVGTESVSAADYRSLHKTAVKEADDVIAKIYKKDPRRAYIAYKYLEDMRKNLREVHKVLKRGGYYILVVGNNRIRNELFENWKYILTMAREIGFKVETYFASEIIKHFIKVPREERINTDWILVLKKSSSESSSGGC